MLSLAVALLTGPRIDLDALYRRIRADYFDPKSGLYREYWSPDRPEKDVAFNWSVGVALSAHNALAKLDAKYKPDLVAFLKQVPRYWNPKGPVAGFDVLPGPPWPNDRYYDDNAWMAMALVESYEVTRDRQWLQLARKTLDYCLSGIDDQQGGVWWRENKKNSKNACSVGPVAASCLAVYGLTNEPKLLTTAATLYDWELAHLVDPADGLPWDNIGVDGKVSETKWSYNAALLIRTARDLARFTHRPNYQTDLDRMQKAAIARWFRYDRVDDELQFAHLLVENVDLEPAHTLMIETSLAAIGDRYGKRWSERPKANARLQLMHQMSVLRTIARLRSRAK